MFCNKCGEPLPSGIPSDTPGVCADCAAVFSVMMQEALERIKKGQPVFLYRSVYIPVDSEIDGNPIANGFDISFLKLYGLLGWDVVTAIPKTLGIALCNRTIGRSDLQTYGAGIGGNVVGVHVLFQKEVKNPLTAEDSNELKRAIESIPSSLVAAS